METLVNPEILLPYAETKLHELNLQLEEETLNAAKRLLDEVDGIEWSTFEEQFNVIFRRKDLEEKQKNLMVQLSDEYLRDYPEYISRVAVLKELGYIDQEERGERIKPKV